MAATHALYDLVCRREYIQPLRDELELVIAEDGQDTDGNGFLKLKKSSLTKLRKLDSFLKESQRLSPPGYSNSSVFDQGSKLMISSLPRPSDNRASHSLNRSHNPNWYPNWVSCPCSPYLASDHDFLAWLQSTFGRATV